MQKYQTLLTPKISDQIPQGFEAMFDWGVWGEGEKNMQHHFCWERAKEFCMLAATVHHFQPGAFMQLTWSYVPGEGLWMSTQHRMEKRKREAFWSGFFCKLLLVLNSQD